MLQLSSQRQGMPICAALTIELCVIKISFGERLFEYSAAKFLLFALIKNHFGSGGSITYGLMDQWIYIGTEPPRAK